MSAIMDRTWSGFCFVDTCIVEDAVVNVILNESNYLMPPFPPLNLNSSNRR